MKILRLPPPILHRFVSFADLYRLSSLCFVSPRDILDAKLFPKPGFSVSLLRLTINRIAQTEMVRVSQVPGWTSLSLPCSWTPVALLRLLPFHTAPVLPPTTEVRRPQHSTEFRGSIAWLQHSLSTLPNLVSLHRQDSLPVGGSAFTGGTLTPIHTAYFNTVAYCIFLRSRLRLSRSAPPRLRVRTS